MGMPLSVLKPSPFTSFLIPGAVLFTVLGIVPLIITGALIKKPVCKLAEMFNCFKDMHWSWTFTIYTAFALMIWIQLEMVFIQAVHWLHTCYVFLAIIMVFVALLPQLDWALSLRLNRLMASSDTALFFIEITGSSISLRERVVPAKIKSDSEDNLKLNKAWC